MTIERIIEIMEENDVNVKKLDAGLELEWYTPAGEDFIFYLDGTTAEEIVKEMDNYYEGFDQNEHIMLFAGKAGTDGVPDIFELAEDAREIDNFLRKLSCLLNEEPYYGDKKGLVRTSEGVLTAKVNEGDGYITICLNDSPIVVVEDDGNGDGVKTWVYKSGNKDAHVIVNNITGEQEL